jgi:CDP-glycerol glycerophosphotransferase
MLGGQNMKTSVIIPYHKGEAFLKDCLDSLREQTGQDMEILLICDHADDKDLECLTDYGDDLSIQVWRLTDKTGVAAARNLGLDKATGDYVYFLDSDDYLYGNTIENLVLSALDRDDDIIYGRMKPTWFGRSVYLVRTQQESEEAEKEGEDNETVLAELNVGDQDSGKRTTFENNTEEELSGEENSEEEDKDELSEDHTGSDTGEDTEEEQAQEEELTPEEQIALEQYQLEARRKQAYRNLVGKKKEIRSITVLNILFKRSFLEENKIRFPENLKYMSDIPFLLEALSKTDKFKKRLSAKYVKRRHNDSINLPSLSQIKDPNRFNEMISSYYETTGRIPADSQLREIYDKKYISYYAKTFAPRLKRSLNNIWREDNFLLMSDVIGSMNKELLSSLKGYKKRIIKALIRKDVKKSLRLVKTHLAIRKLKRILKNKKAFAKFLYEHTFIKKPLLDNCILFESFFGKNYSDSPKYIYEYLAKNYSDQYKFVWVIDKKNTQIPYRHKKIRRFGIQYAYYLARSKYFVFNGRQPEWVKKREGNIFLQTWHGTPLKKLVFDLDDINSASPKYKQQVYRQQKVWDYLIAPNAFSSETFRRCFMFENTMLETGYPRNDILHAPNRDEIAAKIKKKLDLPSDKKVILYAPTWRDDEYYAIGQYKFELHMNLNMMREQLGQDYIVLLRTHYFIADSLDVSELLGFAYNMSRYDDISELYLISDILITDYSSVFFDYANLRRPMLFFTYDLEKYRDVLRGFYFDIEKEVPGPLLFTTEEIVEAVRNIDRISRDYSQRYEEFYHRFCEWEDGHAAEKVVKSVFVR